MIAALGVTPLEAYIGRDLLCILPNETDVRELKPAMDKMKSLDGLLVQVTAKGKIMIVFQEVLLQS
uniref:hypothetical protein n=1 Tax=Ndongobacter massiliensis TaxID=1871025 RepID=UPI0012FF43FB|nr:hypothetical protein [Ndongobacter massiliensis]